MRVFIHIFSSGDKANVFSHEGDEVPGDVITNVAYNIHSFINTDVVRALKWIKDYLELQRGRVIIVYYAVACARIHSARGPLLYGRICEGVKSRPAGGWGRLAITRGLD